MSDSVRPGRGQDDGCPVTLCPGALAWLLGHDDRDRDAPDDEAMGDARWTLTTPVPVSGAD
jgi:hypothetical protein